MSKIYRILFAGTPEFALPSLRELINSQHNIIGVYTQPDRPAGRGRKLHASPVKQLAEEYNIPIYQPKSLKTAEEKTKLEQLAPDLMIVIAYGQILPGDILAIPKYGCINVHASILPRWRGAAPIQAAILTGDQQTGVTIMQMDVGLDTGPMLLTKACPINPGETGQQIHDKLSELGSTALLEVINNLDQFPPQTQNERLASYAKKITKQDGLIDWQQPANIIVQRICAYNPWPIAFSYIDQQLVKIYQASAKADEAHTAEPGTIINSNPQNIAVATAQGVLQIEKLQLAGGKVLTAQQILNSRSELFDTGKKFQDSPE